MTANTGDATSRGRAIGLRLVAFDATDVRGKITTAEGHQADGTARGPIALTPWWRAGALMHRLARGARGEAVATRAVQSWEEVLRWAASESSARRMPIADLQVWGHGGWGFMELGSSSRLDVRALAASSPVAPLLDALRDAMTDDALFWLRCCSAFGSHAGRAFAPALAERLRVRVAGHTYVIHALQSGTHSLARGDVPTWSEDEGVVTEGTRHVRAKDSMPFEPRTLSCLRLDLPASW